MQDLLSTALDSPTGKRPLDLPTCSAPSPRRLRAARHLAALAATERRIKGRRALAPARAAAGRLRRACARRCRVLRRRLGPREGLGQWDWNYGMGLYAFWRGEAYRQWDGTLRLLARRIPSLRVYGEGLGQWDGTLRLLARRIPSLSVYSEGPGQEFRLCL